MRKTLLVAGKDLAILFRSPLAYVIMAAFLVLCGYFFASSVRYFELVSIQVMQNPAVEGFTPHGAVVVPYLQNAGVILLFLLPLITMRGFAEEKHSGAFEMLLSYPLAEHHLVLGKLLAVAAFVAALLAAAALNLVLLAGVSELEWAPTLWGLAGLFLAGAAFASLGLFLSSLTESQVVAAVSSFAALLVLWLLAWTADMAPEAAKPAVEALSLMTHFESFTKGVVSLADLAYYVLFITAFAWLSVLSLETQRWRA